MRYRLSQTIDRTIEVDIKAVRAVFPKESKQYPDDDLLFLEDALDNDAFPDADWTELASEFNIDALGVGPTTPKGLIDR